MSKKPLCRKCGTEHFNFVACAEAEAFNQRLVPQEAGTAGYRTEFHSNVPQYGGTVVYQTDTETHAYDPVSKAWLRKRDVA